MWNSVETATERAVFSSSLHGGCCGNHVIRWGCQGGCYRDGGEEPWEAVMEVEDRGKESAVTGARKVEVVSGFDSCSEGKENEVFSKDIGFSSVLAVRGEAGHSDLMSKEMVRKC